MFLYYIPSFSLSSLSCQSLRPSLFSSFCLPFLSSLLFFQFFFLLCQLLLGLLNLSSRFIIVSALLFSIFDVLLYFFVSLYLLRIFCSTYLLFLYISYVSFVLSIFYVLQFFFKLTFRPLVLNYLYSLYLIYVCYIYGDSCINLDFFFILANTPLL